MRNACALTRARHHRTTKVCKKLILMVTQTRARRVGVCAHYLALLSRCAATSVNWQAQCAPEHEHGMTTEEICKSGSTAQSLQRRRRRGRGEQAAAAGLAAAPATAAVDPTSRLLDALTVADEDLAVQ